MKNNKKRFNYPPESLQILIHSEIPPDEKFSPESYDQEELEEYPFGETDTWVEDIELEN